MIGHSLVALAAGLLGPFYPTAEAGNYEMVASGPVLNLDIRYAETFDGTTMTADTLPALLDVARLAGGSFRATYHFSTEYTDDDGIYIMSPSTGITFDLLDASGGVVHHGDNSFEPQAFVGNNSGSPPYVTDQASFFNTMGSISGLALPVPLYGPSELSLQAALDFGGNVSEGHDYLTDRNIPLDAATYLAFPHRELDVQIGYDDGDYPNGPYQIAGIMASWRIDALTVTPVPEPSAFPLAGIALVSLLTFLRAMSHRVTHVCMTLAE